MITAQKIPSTKCRTWANIDIGNVEYNFTQIKNSTQKKVCCVIKANAYGHGAVQLARLYQSLGADYLAVSNIEEALQLRSNQIALPILILGYTSCDCTKILSEHNITQCVFSYEYGMKLAENAQAQGVSVKVHIKIDTGMGRIGFLCRDDLCSEMEKAIVVCKQPSLDVEGVFMHFAVADEGTHGEDYTREQFEKFIDAIGALESQGVTFKIKHCANSAAIFDYPEFHLDMVRAGIVLYGLKPSEQVKHLPTLKPIMSLHSVIAHIKVVEKGQTISYGRTYTASCGQRIATIPIGYADGFRRMNGQHGYSVCINGKAAPIVGRVCMDQLMVDITSIDCNLGDEVIVFCDTYPYTVDELANINDTINYEIVCDVGERVPRAYIQDSKIIEWKDDLLDKHNINKTGSYI